MAKPPVPHYRPLAIGLHWIIAALLVFQLALGWRMTSMPRSAVMFDAFQLHKSIGIVVLALSLLRVVVRVVMPRPAPVAGPRWQQVLAEAVHGLLYVFMIGAPITGWIVVSTAPVAIATMLFHTLPLPHLPVPHGWHDGAAGSHGALAWLGLALIGLHIAGALKHQFAANPDERVAGRMIPVAPGRVWAGLALALGGLGAAFALPWVVFQPAPTPVAPPVAVATLAPDAQETPEAAPSEQAPLEQASMSAPANTAWAIDPGGKLGFTATVNNSAVEGQFASWSGKISYDPQAPEAAKVAITVNLASASTADQTRDTMLQGPEFFGASPAGKAVFTAKGFKSMGKDKFAANGTLAINGVKVPVRLLFDLTLTGDRAVAKGSADLDRLALHVGTGQWGGTDQIGAGVALRFSLKAHRATGE